MRVDDKVAANEMVQDCVRLGEIEGLFGHAAAARARLAANGVAEPGLPISPSASFILPSANPSANAERLMFGVPKKGRLNERCLKFLEAAGLDYHRPDRVDVAQVTNLPITLVFLPAADIAQYVGEGDVDLGITGEDIIAETGARVNLEMKLGFGKCKLAVQVPKAHKDARSASTRARASSRPSPTSRQVLRAARRRRRRRRRAADAGEVRVGWSSRRSSSGSPTRWSTWWRRGRRYAAKPTS